MFKNYLKTALRNIARNRISTFVNIVGLALAISSCVLIFMYVSYQLSFDKHFSKADRTYRVWNEMNFQGQMDKVAASPFMLGPTLKAEYPEVEEQTRLMHLGPQTVWYEDKVYDEDEVYYADSTLFKVLDYKLLKGNPQTALAAPRTIVISKSMAQKYFGNEDAIGKVLKFTKNSFTVTGVLDEPKEPSHIQPNALLALSTMDSNLVGQMQQDWFRLAFYTYIVLKDKKYAQGFDQKLQKMVDAHITPFIKQYNLNSSIKFAIQPLTAIHLDNFLSYDTPTNTNRSYLYIFSFVAIFILLIGCINYMNLATARATKRAREVGIRKVLGAERKQLIWQFIGESILISLLSLFIALILAEVLLPYFNDFTEIPFSLNIFGNLKMILLLLGIVVTIGLIGGSYPAFFLSSFKPVDVLKSQKIPGGLSGRLRKSLVVLQFIISTVLVIGTLVVYGQMHYMKTKDLGFKKDNVLAIKIPGGDPQLASRLDNIKNELLQNTQVKKVAIAASSPGEQLGKLIFFVDRGGKKQETAMNFNFGDYDMIPLLNIKMVKGRNFSRDMASDDTGAFIVNEAAAKLLNAKDPLGVQMENGLGYNGKVIGVVKDFHFASLHNAIDPLVIMLRPKGPGGGEMLINIAPNDIPGTVDYIESKWKSFVPNRPMNYFFVDQQFDKLYRKEEKMLAIFGYFSLLTIIIACLGLFGLSSFMAEQRTKEIGIRKVNGASDMDIVLIFVKDFMKLIGISLLIAWPLSYWLMNHWLQDFAYRISLSPLFFIVAGLLATFITLGTIVYQAINSALTSPVKALRYE